MYWQLFQESEPALEYIDGFTRLIVSKVIAMTLSYIVVVFHIDCWRVSLPGRVDYLKVLVLLLVLGLKCVESLFLSEIVLGREGLGFDWSLFGFLT